MDWAFGHSARLAEVNKWKKQSRILANKQQSKAFWDWSLCKRNANYNREPMQSLTCIGPLGKGIYLLFLKLTSVTHFCLLRNSLFAKQTISGRNEPAVQSFFPRNGPCYKLQSQKWNVFTELVAWKIIQAIKSHMSAVNIMYFKYIQRKQHSWMGLLFK